MSEHASTSRSEPNAGDAPPQFAIERHFFFWLTQLLDRRDRQLTARLRSAGLRAPEWRVLGSLYSRQRLSMSELADLANIERTTLSRTVDRMVSVGWINRLSDTSDARVTRLTLTAAGERVFTRIWPVVHDVNQAAIAGVPEPAVEMARWALEQMCRNFDALDLRQPESA